MSMQEHVATSCPQCNKPAHGDRWATVNVTLNPELREDVLTGKIRTAQCPFCATRFVVNHHFLYHDMERRFIISYQPTESGRSQPIPSAPLALMGALLSHYRLRFVTSWNQLREKIAIFEALLQDYPVEVIKLLLGSEIFDTPKFGNDAIYFLERQTDASGAIELVFQVFEGKKYLTDARSPLVAYQTLARGAEKQFGSPHGLGEWITVNQASLYNSPNFVSRASKQRAQQNALANVCYTIAYKLLPKRLYSEPQKTLLTFTLKGEGASFWYEIGCQARRRQPIEEDRRSFNTFYGRMATDVDSYILEYPSPPPLNILEFQDHLTHPVPSRVDIDTPVLAPYFSGILHRKSDHHLRYCVLGQGIGNRATLRSVGPNGQEAVLGFSPEHSLDAFVGILHSFASGT